MSGLSHDDIAQIREGYRLFKEGNPAFLDRFEPDARIIFPESLPKGGTYASPLEALEFWNNTGQLFEDADPEPEEFVRNRDRLVVLGRFRGRSRATGEQIVVRFAHAYALTDAEGPMSEQKYTSFELIIDTAPVLAALAEEDRG